MKDPKSCLITVEYSNNLGQYSYHNCGKPAKYKVNFKDSTSGRFREEFVCGVHFRSLEKNCDRLKNIHNYDSEFKYEKLT